MDMDMHLILTCGAVYLPSRHVKQKGSQELTRSMRLAGVCLTLALIPTVFSAQRPFQVAHGQGQSISSSLVQGASVAVAPVYMQGNFTCPQASLGIVGVTYRNPQTAGDLDVVVVGWNDIKVTINSVSDSAGNTYHVAVPTMRANGMSQAIYYAPNIVGAPTNSIKVKFASPSFHADIRIMEYKNVARTKPFQAGAKASGKAGPARSGAISIAAASQLLVVAGMTQQSFSGAGAGFTLRMLTTPDGDLVEDRIAPSPGAYRATAELNGNWIVQVAAFRGL
jgi:hypothetical protein